VLENQPARFCDEVNIPQINTAPIFSTDPDAATRVWSGRESEPVAAGQGPGEAHWSAAAELTAACSFEPERGDR
jgi:hypothetical protein